MALTTERKEKYVGRGTRESHNLLETPSSLRLSGCSGVTQRVPGCAQFEVRLAEDLPGSPPRSAHNVEDVTVFSSFS